ncbi:hypothetical protein FB451DRAFT_1170284 [Mycena latifolia]|nr:hypothetical protein FB451DRAFT_1170284 [Mycena latifolia]
MCNSYSREVWQNTSTYPTSCTFGVSYHCLLCLMVYTSPDKVHHALINQTSYGYCAARAPGEGTPRVHVHNHVAVATPARHPCSRPAEARTRSGAGRVPGRRAVDVHPLPIARHLVRVGPVRCGAGAGQSRIGRVEGARTGCGGARRAAVSAHGTVSASASEITLGSPRSTQSRFLYLMFPLARRGIARSPPSRIANDDNSVGLSAAAQNLLSATAKPIIDLVKKIAKLTLFLPETVPLATEEDDIPRRIFELEGEDEREKENINLRSAGLKELLSDELSAPKTRAAVVIGVGASSSDNQDLWEGW